MKYKELIAKELASVLKRSPNDVSKLFEEPKNELHGDIAFPCFTLSKEKNMSPATIATELAAQINIDNVRAIAAGPYVNFTISDPEYVISIIKDINSSSNLITQTKQASKVLVESPGPNTNKPLHIGHLRNILLGQSITNMLKAIGKEVHIVNVINDRGIHIAKSMLAYKKWGNDQLPQNLAMKPDHFVGHWYVRFAQECAKSSDTKEQIEKEAKELLVRWEQGDTDTIALWRKMNNWVYEGFEETYNKLDFHIEKNYFESDTYLGGKDIIKQGVKDGIFFEDESGAVMVDLSDKKLDKKILLRADGTSVYITQDINMANLRYKDYQFDEQIYVVANEQEYHFKVLFEVFKLLNWPFADKCKHFSYGMVELPSGKLKSREGNIIDIDDLLKDTLELAKTAVKERFPDLDNKEIDSRAHMIAHGAIRFFFLKQNPLNNFVFDPKASLAFEGETGPYVQYTHARICSILRKADTKPDYTAQPNDNDKHIAKLLTQFDGVVNIAANQLKPNLLCNYLLSLCQAFNTYYSKNIIIQDDKDVQSWRLSLISAVNKVIKEGLSLLHIQAPEKM